MENTFQKLDIFVERLEKIGITIRLAGNFPWIYLDTINGKKVTERFQAEHGFTIGYYPIRHGQAFKFTDLKEIFKVIRQYREKEKQFALCMTVRKATGAGLMDCKFALVDNDWDTKLAIEYLRNNPKRFILY